MQWRLYDPADPPYWTTPEFYAGREAAPHLEQEGHRERLLLTADMVIDALDRFGKQNPGKLGSVLDLGAGDGGLISLFRGKGAVIGYDLQQSNIDAAKGRGVVVELKDVVTELPPIFPTDVLVATELLEHLLEPAEFVRRLHASPARHLVASSPYTETPESHYEFHTWAWDLDGYRALLEDAGWRVIRQETAWISQVLLCQSV